MARNPLAVPLTTAAVIAELRLKDAAITPEARRAAAVAAASFMTVEQRVAIAARNAEMYALAAHKVKMSAIGVNGRAPAAETRSRPDGAGSVPRACPRCGMEARGRGDGERVDWFGGHYRSAHPEMGY
jgi:hypothetical protein